MHQDGSADRCGRSRRHRKGLIPPSPLRPWSAGRRSVGSEKTKIRSLRNVCYRQRRKVAHREKAPCRGSGPAFSGNPRCPSQSGMKYLMCQVSTDAASTRSVGSSGERPRTGPSKGYGQAPSAKLLPRGDGWPGIRRSACPCHANAADAIPEGSFSTPSTRSPHLKRGPCRSSSAHSTKTSSGARSPIRICLPTGRGGIDASRSDAEIDHDTALMCELTIHDDFLICR